MLRRVSSQCRDGRRLARQASFHFSGRQATFVAIPGRTKAGQASSLNFGTYGTWPSECRLDYGMDDAAGFVYITRLMKPGQGECRRNLRAGETWLAKFRFNFGRDDTRPGEFRLSHNFGRVEPEFRFISGTGGTWPSEFRLNFGTDAAASFVSILGQMKPGQAGFVSVSGRADAGQATFVAIWGPMLQRACSSLCPPESAKTAHWHQ